MGRDLLKIGRGQRVGVYLKPGRNLHSRPTSNWVEVYSGSLSRLGRGLLVEVYPISGRGLP